MNQTGFGVLVFDAGREGPSFTSARVTLQPPGSREPGGATALLWEAGR